MNIALFKFQINWLDKSVIFKLKLDMSVKKNSILWVSKILKSGPVGNKEIYNKRIKKSI